MNRTASRMTSIVALVAVFSLGIAFVIIGAISEELKRALSLTNADIGSLVFALFLTSMIVQLVIGPLVDKFGHKSIAQLGFCVLMLSMSLLSLKAADFRLALLACILMGVGAMCVNTVGNTLIPAVLFGGKDPARASNFGNAFFGLGLVVTPLLFSVVPGYRDSLKVLQLLFLIFLLCTFPVKFPAVSTGYRFSMAFRLLGNRSVLIAALALFCYISLEASMNTWSKPYMTELWGGGADAAARAGFVLSLFGVAMMVGRFATSMIKNLTAIGVRLIAGASVVAMGAILLMILTHDPAVAVAAVMLTGLVFAPIFPTIVGVTFAKFEPNLYGSIFGIIFPIGLLGATFVPKIVGNLSVGATVQQGLLIVFAMAVALLVISLFLGAGAKKDTPPVS
jgi:fucose permease